MMIKNVLSYVLVFVGCLNMSSQTKIASVFQDHMVLQRNTKVNIWGVDKPNKLISISSSWGEVAKTKTDSKGVWNTIIKTGKAGGPYTLLVEGSKKILLEDILLGEVWLCGGQSNMAMKLKGGPGQHIEGSNEAILKSTNAQLRFFNVQKAVSNIPLNVCGGQWDVASPKTAAEFSAVAYFFGNMIQESLDVPVGLISSNVGGTPLQAWTSRDVLDREFPEFKNASSQKVNTKSPAVLFNGMINPLIPFTIKGSIWYQGEGNRWNPEQYSRLFPAMIKNWRTKWKQGDYPFYFVQLAPYGPGGNGWVGIQQAQLKTRSTVPKTGMAVINDVGYKTRIHPPKKKEVGERLALLALYNDYGITGITCNGPVYKSKMIKGNKVTVFFDETANGLTSLGKPLKDFELAGVDGIFYPATAKITKKGACLEVVSEQVPKPLHVRYAWSSYVEGSLFNTAGLPASCFSSQSWKDIFTGIDY